MKKISKLFVISAVTAGLSFAGSVGQAQADHFKPRVNICYRCKSSNWPCPYHRGAFHKKVHRKYDRHDRYCHNSRHNHHDRYSHYGRQKSGWNGKFVIVFGD
ncbi:MAG TPA: hypothetical protein VI749_08135 [Candidatus Omnitrophota bacterium]|nr:hypothetical protein [Candidatus Omnitrophota bacterium]